MKKLILLFFTMIGVLLIGAGCSSLTTTTTTETAYSADGQTVTSTKVTKTDTEKSLADTVVESTKEKQVFISDQSYLYGLRFVPPGSSSENPFGIFELIFGRQDKIIITTPMNKVMDTNTAKISDQIKAARAGDIGITTTGSTDSRPQGGE